MEQDWKKVEEALAQAKAGNQEGYSYLYEAYVKMVFVSVAEIISGEEEREDIVQEAFFKVFQRIQNGDKIDNFGGYIKNAALNVAKDHIKKREAAKRPKEMSDVILDEEGKEASLFDTMDSADTVQYRDNEYYKQPDLILEESEVSEILADILSEISTEQRECLVQYYMNDTKISELAKLYQVSDNTIKSRLYQGRTKVEKKVMELETKKGIKLRSAGLVVFFFLMRREILSNASGFKGSFDEIVPKMGLEIADGTQSVGTGGMMQKMAGKTIPIVGKTIGVKSFVAGVTAVLIGVGAITGVVLQNIHSNLNETSVEDAGLEDQMPREEASIIEEPEYPFISITEVSSAIIPLLQSEDYTSIYTYTEEHFETIMRYEYFEQGDFESVSDCETTEDAWIITDALNQVKYHYWDNLENGMKYEIEYATEDVNYTIVCEENAGDRELFGEEVYRTDNSLGQTFLIYKSVKEVTVLPELVGTWWPVDILVRSGFEEYMGPEMTDRCFVIREDGTGTYNYGEMYTDIYLVKGTNNEFTYNYQGTTSDGTELCFESGGFSFEVNGDGTVTATDLNPNTTTGYPTFVLQRAPY